MRLIFTPLALLAAACDVEQQPPWRPGDPCPDYCAKVDPRDWAIDCLSCGADGGAISLDLGGSDFGGSK